jgi:putative redox protein
MANLTATARSIPGTLRQHVLIDGSHHLVTDEPIVVGGDGSAPSPHELLPAALAACVSTVLVMYARTKEWDLGDVCVDVSYDHHATPRRFDVSIALGGDLDDEQLARLEKVAATCPVRRALEAGVAIEERQSGGVAIGFERRRCGREVAVARRLPSASRRAAAGSTRRVAAGRARISRRRPAPCGEAGRARV